VVGCVHTENGGGTWREFSWLKMNVERFDVAALVREVIDCLSVLGDEKHQAITVDTPQPAPVNADRFVLREAIMNIVDNAIKYSARHGTIRVTVGVGPTP
jgi:signal transduction histidine kinase